MTSLHSHLEPLNGNRTRYDNVDKAAAVQKAPLLFY